ncbi:hypothetical protein CMI48_00360 [Candidatus Pacearchaeota archaeon]|jgi:hypothetical protein|nr:hypothetical protein [Candidatus Pacearchaeota archaeon]|tara:strand:+ start:152 stop:940 length:789 start_codon:yes stop_codon:yes gene_type:complete
MKEDCCKNPENPEASKKEPQEPDCCQPTNQNNNSKNPSALKQGILYGLIPHIGCIAFIVAAVLGATVLMQLFKPLLMNRYIFHYLILISAGFATLSSFFYLKKHNSLSIEGIKRKEGYLYTMYGTTIGINLILFFLIFPYTANITGSVSALELTGLSTLAISVDIPCPGHAPLISREVKTIDGVQGSQFSFPNDFEVYYDPLETSEQEILSLEVFQEYPATRLSPEPSQPQQVPTQAGSCSGGCGGAGSCGGGCGSPSCGNK